MSGGVSFANIGDWPYGIHLHFGIHPSLSLPSSGWGLLPNSAWNGTNGFVSPIDYINSNNPPGGSSPSGKSDLVVREVNLSKNNLMPGESFKIDTRIKNIGDSDIANAFHIKYLLSNGKSRDSSPTNLGEDSISLLAKGVSKWEDITVNAPNNPGAYNITVKADSDSPDGIDESSEGNNYFDPPVIINVLADPPPDHALVNQDGDGTTYLFYNGRKWPIADPDTLFALGFTWDDLITYPLGTLNKYSSAPVILSEGLLGQFGTDIYIFEAGTWRYLPNWAYMDCRGGQHPENVLPIPQSLFDKYGRGADITPCNITPEGWFDRAACSGMEGWARDPDTTLPIGVHIYANGPAGVGTVVASLTADILRSDLTSVDKNHGFNIPIPDSLRDSQPHPLYVYAIDSSGGGPNPLLNGSPQTITCDPFYLLTISKGGNGTGTVSSSIPGISCGADCSESYLKGTTVSLTASHDANAVFTGWSGGASGIANLVTVTVASPLSLTANFALNQFTISGKVTRGGAGLGGITMNGLPGNPVTNGAGDFSAVVDYGWSGKVTLSKYGYRFTPSSLDIATVTSNRPNTDFAGAMIETEFSLKPGSSEGFAVLKGELNAGAYTRTGSDYGVKDRLGDGFGVASLSLQVTNLIVTTPEFINFGSVATGDTSASTLSVKNEGTDAVTIVSLNVTGANAGEFAIQNDTCTGHLFLPGGFCTLDAVFMPLSTGSKDATLNIGAGSVVQVPLSGASVTIADSFPPAGFIEINNGVASTAFESVALTISATDVSGVSEMCISNTNICENWEVFAERKLWELTEGDGVKSLFAWFRDNLGNTNYSPFFGTITLDTTKPITTASTKGGVYADEQTITLTSNELGPIYFTEDGRNPTTASQVYAGAITVSSNTAIKFYSVDLAGNQGDVQSEVYLVGAQPVLEDMTAPTVTVFTMPTTSDSLTVPVAELTATDNVAVTGYLLIETASQPQTDHSAWTTLAPDSYSFSTQGVKTLYAFAKDVVGYISVPLAASVTITLADTAAPTVTIFTIPLTSNSLTVPVSILTSTDDVAIISYLLTETASQPQADNPAWSESVPLSYIFATEGVKTLYVFAKDTAGNISVPLSASVTIMLPDTIAPTVTAFTLPATANDLVVPVFALVATDAGGVTDYLLSESTNQPRANDLAWSATEPISYTFTTQGAKTLYAFAKDAAGNVSSPASAAVVITLSDVTAPAITAFTLPATLTSLTVPVTSLAAMDDVAVAKYLLNETETTPSVTDLHWTTTPTSSYTFANAGAKMLYAWAKDAAGNISAGLSATVTITLPDTTAPTVNLLTLPQTATSLTIAVTALSATDDVAVTGYLLSESATLPQLDNPAWTSTPPTSYTLAAQGSRTIYAFAKDAAGNVSAPLSANVTITLPDTDVPTVTAFALTSTSTSLTVPVLVFSATDNVAITGYILSESALMPLAVDPAWRSTPPNSYTFSTEGSKTLYAFARDVAGNISSSAIAGTTITLPDITAPTVTAFTLPATSSSLTEAISSFAASDFVGVTGYCLAATNNSSGCNWSATAPSSYTFTTAGSKTLYAFAKDAAGNVSSSKSATTTITLPTVGYGDIDNDGDTTSTDAMFALHMAIGKKSLDLLKSDVAPLINGIPAPDGKVTAADALVILRKAVGLW